MRVTSQNINEINYFCEGNTLIECDRSLLSNLVLDAVSVNMFLERINPDRKIYIVDSLCASAGYDTRTILMKLLGIQ